MGATVTSTAIATASPGSFYLNRLRPKTGHIVIITPLVDKGAFYLTGPVDNISSWKHQPLPVDSGWKQALDANVGLAIEASGKPVIAWYETQDEADGRRFEV